MPVKYTERDTQTQSLPQGLGFSILYRHKARILRGGVRCIVRRRHPLTTPGVSFPRGRASLVTRFQHRIHAQPPAQMRIVRLCALVAVLFTSALVGCSQSPQLPPPAYYRFDDHLSDAVRADAAAPHNTRGALAFTFDGGEPLDWHPGKPSSTCAIEDDALVFTAGEADGVTSPGGLAIDGASVDTIELRMQVSESGRYVLRWRAREADWTEIHRVLKIHVTRPDEMVSYRLEVAGVRAWRHRTIDQIRLTTDAPARVTIDEIRFLTRKESGPSDM